MPEDRKPTNAEIEMGRAALKEEIERVKPTAIIALGDSALQSLCKLSGISNKRGQDFPRHGDYGVAVSVHPTYHPAYVLRVPQTRDTVVADFRKVRDRLKPQDEVPWKWTGQGDYLLTPFAWDIETDWNPSIKGSGDKITQIAIADKNCAHVRDTICDFGTVEATTVTHNGWAFDVPMMHKNGFQAPWGRDTMVMAYLDDETQPLGLEALCVKYLGVRGWKEDKSAPLGSDEFAMYNARDAWYTLKLYEVLKERLGDRIKIADKLILPAYLALRAASAKGTYIDQVAVQKFLVEYDQQQAFALDRIQEMVPGLNPNSTPQVLRAFALPEYGYELASSDKAHLQEISRLGGRPGRLADHILSFRNAAKGASTLRAYGEMERARPTYNLWRTDTGRSSANNPNVQNLDRRFKSIFAAPPGFVRISADYSAIEFRLAAWVAGETSILERYAENPDWDPHRYFASLFYGKPEEEVTKDERQVAKSANFSQLYMGNGETMVNYAAKMGIHLDRKEAYQIHQAWHRAFPGFRGLYAATKAEILAQGYVETATGRRRHFGDVSGLRPSAFQECLRQGVNMKVQSLAFDVAAAALGLLGKEFGDATLLTDFIHDSIAEEILDRPPYIRFHKKLLKQVMTKDAPAYLLKEFGVDLTTIPLTIDFTETRCSQFS